MKVRRTKENVRLLSIMLVLCMVFSLFPTMTFAGTDQEGYWGNTVNNVHIGSKENITIAQVNAAGDVTWENVAYCYNKDRGYPVGKYDGTTYSNEYEYLEAQDPATWKNMSNNTGYAGDMKDILTKIVFIGYPYEGTKEIRNILKNDCKVADAYLEDAFRTATQKAIWHITDKRAFGEPSNGSIPTGNTSAQVSGYVAKKIYEKALAYTGTPTVPVRLWKWKGVNNRNQHLLDTGYNIRAVEVTMSKLDHNGQPLAGVRIQIKQENQVIEEFISPNEDKELRLTPGTYTYHEESVPEGCEAVDDFEFTVNENGTITLEEGVDENIVSVNAQGILVVRAPQQQVAEDNSIEVQIAAKKTIDGGQTPIGNNTFEFKLTGNGQELTATSDANGNILFDAMTFTQPGTYTYTITEVTDPRDGVTFDFDHTPKTVTVTVSAQDLQTYDPNITYYAFEEYDYDSYYYVDTTPGGKGIVMYCTNADLVGPQYSTIYPVATQTYRVIINPTISVIKSDVLVHLDDFGNVNDEANLIENLKKLFYYFETAEGQNIPNNDKQALVWSATDGEDRIIDSISVNGKPASRNTNDVLTNIYETVTLPPIYNLAFFVPKGATQIGRCPQPLATGYGAVVEATTNGVVFNNKTKEADTGNLVITKTLEGDVTAEEAEGAISFTVTGPDNFNETYTLADFTNNNGVYTLEINGVQVGEYTVEESTHDIDGKTVTVTYTVNGGQETEGDSTTAEVTKGETATVAFNNNYSNDTGNLVITKTLAGDVTPEEAEGVLKFKVTAPDGTFEEYTIKDDFTKNEDGKYTLELNDVLVGEYTVEETTKDIDGKTVTVTYTVNGGQETEGDSTTAEVTNGGTATVAFKNDYSDNVGNLVITKTIEGDVTKEEAEGAITFTVTGPDNFNETYTLADFTESNGVYTLTLNDVKVGQYTVEETTHDIDGTTVTVTYTVNGGQEATGDVATAEVTNGGTATVAFENNYVSDNTVTISKIKLGGQPLAGAKIQIIAQDGTVIESYTSTTEAKEITVAPGTYTFHEEAAPNGYKVVTDFSFTVAEDGTVELTNVAADVAQYVDGVLVVTDQYEEQNVVISKVDLGGQPLAGAHIQIKNAAGTVIKDYTSTTGTETINVTPGTYTFHEEAAPNGYKAVTDFNFTLEEDGTVTLNGVDSNVAKYENGVLVVTDQFVDGEVEVSKTDIAGKELPGAKLKITGRALGGDNIDPIEWTSTGQSKKVRLYPGEYTLTETSAPNGYEKAESIEFAVHVTPNGDAVILTPPRGKDAEVVEKLVMVDGYSNQNVVISKKDIAGDELPGATLEVTGTAADGTTIEPITWISTETAKTISLQPGTYTLTETTAPDGYEEAESITFTVSLDSEGNAVVMVGNDNVNGQVTMVDGYSNQNVVISKTDIAGDELPGATLNVTGTTADGTVIEPITWISTETAKTISLQPGTYTLTETTAPNGYEVAESITFTVSLDEQGNAVVMVGNDNVNGQVTMVDNYSNQNVVISKTDIAGDELPGATLNVTGTTADGTVIEPITWISTETAKTISLQPGTYTLTETTAPNGYEVAESITFTVFLDEEGNAVVMVGNDNVNGRVTMVDGYSNQNVVISKKNIAGDELPGATLNVTGTTADGTVIEPITWISTETAKTISLQPGTYTLHEEAAPNGYKVVNDFTFTVAEDGTVELTNVAADVAQYVDGVLVVKDQYEEQNVVISKVNLGGAPLAGAHIQIKNAAGTVIKDYTSTTGTETINVAPGTYTFHEDAAPAGYQTVTDFTFTVNENGEVTVNAVDTTEAKYENGVLVVTDKDIPQPEEFPVEISKVNLGGAPLAGAHIIITDKDGNVIKDYTSTTGTETINVTPGAYTFHEDAAPAGYQTVTDFTFTVNENGEVTVNAVDTTEAKYENGVLVVTDKDIPQPEEFPVEISKVNLGGAPLAGAHIIITDKDGNVIKDYTSTTGTETINVAPGAYTFHEDAAPAGYQTVTDFTFTVNENGEVTVNAVDTTEAKYENGVLVVTDKDIPQPEEFPVEISKVKLGGQPLAGAHIIITDKDGNVIKDYTSTTGTETINVAPGTYTFHEEAAPAGYQTVTDFTFTVNENGEVTVNAVDTTEAKYENGVLVVTDKDIPQPEEFPVEISKVNLGGAPLAGAHIQIKDKDGKVIKDYTSTTGTETINVAPGTYTFHEEAAPNGYKVVTDFSFTVAEDGTVELTNVAADVAQYVDGVMVVTDQYEEQNVVISKVDLGGQPLAGAHIIITDKDGNVIKDYTSTTGTETINVAPGTYTFHEEAAPAGYQTVTDFTFTVNENGEVTVNAVDTTEAKYENGVLVVTDKDIPQPEEFPVEISKVKLGGQPLAGAHIIITDKDGNVIKDYTSTTGTETINVAPGTYTFHEDAAPAGYQTVTDFTFTVNENGEVTVNAVDTTEAKYENGVLVVTDKDIPQPEEFPVVISKVKLGGQPLAGAHIQIKDKDGKVIKDYTSTTGTETINVAPGTYTFHEEAAPNGYKVVTDFSFTVAEDGTVELTNVAADVAQYVDGVLVVTDQYEEQNVVISKVDLGGQPLAGAHIQIKNAAGTVIKDYTSTTGTETITVTPGTYTFHEEAAPEGYQVVTDFTFTVAEDGTVTVNGVDTTVAKYEDGKLIVTDLAEDTPEEPKEATVAISKVDLGGQPLEGAHIVVTDKDGNVVADYTSTKEVKTITVAPGTYTFHEEAAPEGYQVVTDFTFTVAEDGTVTVNGVDTTVAKYEDGKLIVTDLAEDTPEEPKEATVAISKVDLGGQPLEGAHIVVTDKDGKVVADYTSTKEVKTITVAPGTYTFHEEAAPEGYQVVTDFTFTVAEDGTVTVNGVDTTVAKYEDDKLIVTDLAEDTPEEPKEVTVAISKVDLGGQPLEGAHIVVTDKDGKVVADYTSTKEVKTITVAPGTYTFHEEAAPNGYKVVTDFTFTVAEDGTVTVNGVDTTVAKYEDGKLIVTDLAEDTPEKPDEEKPENPGEEPDDEKPVETGDDTNVMTYVLLLELSMAACALEVLNILKKKRNNNC